MYRGGIIGLIGFIAKSMKSWIGFFCIRPIILDGVDPRQ